MDSEFSSDERGTLALGGDRWLEFPRFFILVFLVHFSSLSTTLVSDTLPTSINIFALYQFGSLYYDHLCGALNQQFVDHFPAVRLSSGYLSTFYPIGMTILTAPIYGVALVVMLLFGVDINLLSADFEIYRQVVEKVSACFISALAVHVFAILIHEHFKGYVSKLIMPVYAFGTGLWSVCAENLWQHGGIVLLLTLAMLMVFRQSKTLEKPSGITTAWYGFIVGFLFTIRPTSLFFSIALTLCWRTRTRFFWLGILSGVLPSLVWNIILFHHPLGGYQTYFGGQLTTWDPSFMMKAAIGLLFDPLRGMFIFSPVVILAVVGFIVFVREEKDRDVRRLMFFLSTAGIILFVYYSTNKYWQGGFVYGPRYLLDTLPILFFFISVALDAAARGGSLFWRRGVVLGFALLSFFSIGVHAAFVYKFSWVQINGIPFAEYAANYYPYGFPAPRYDQVFLNECK